MLLLKTMMKLKSDNEINELVKYIKWYGRFKSDKESIAWLDGYVPNWRESHETKITYLINGD